MKAERCASAVEINQSGAAHGYLKCYTSRQKRKRIRTEPLKEHEKTFNVSGVHLKLSGVYLILSGSHLKFSGAHLKVSCAHRKLSGAQEKLLSVHKKLRYTKKTFRCAQEYSSGAP